MKFILILLWVTGNFSSWECCKCSGAEIFFNCYLAAPRPTLGHYRRENLTNSMLITAFWRFWPKVTESQTEVVSLSLAERLVGFEPWFSNSLGRSNTLGYSRLGTHYIQGWTVTTRYEATKTRRRWKVYKKVDYKERKGEKVSIQSAITCSKNRNTRTRCEICSGLFKYVWPFCYHQALKG